MKTKTKDHNSTNWNEVFVEDAGSPTGLIWKISPSKKIKAGTVAGCILTNKEYGQQRFVVQYNKTHWLIHRILWVMRNGEIDASAAVRLNGFADLDIDHIDGNSLNNSADNLRLVSTAVNMRNQKQHSTNTSGVTGVGFITTNGYTYARAQWYNLSGELERKSFSCNKLGKDLAFSMACDYRQKMLTELNASGAGYSDRHGE
jgi:hypothetical protein